jgi:hypothetical protein
MILRTPHDKHEWRLRYLKYIEGRRATLPKMTSPQPPQAT